MADNDNIASVVEHARVFLVTGVFFCFLAVLWAAFGGKGVLNNISLLLGLVGSFLLIQAFSRRDVASGTGPDLLAFALFCVCVIAFGFVLDNTFVLIFGVLGVVFYASSWLRERGKHKLELIATLERDV